MDRTLLWCTGAYVLGEVLVFYGWQTAGWLGILLLFAGNVKNGQGKRMLILPVFFFLGSVLAGKAKEPLALDLWFEKRGGTEAAGAVTGTVARLEKRKEDQVRILLTDCEIFLEEERGRLYRVSKVQAYVYEEPDGTDLPEEGNRIRLSGELLPMEERRNPGVFDQKTYNRSLGISYSFNGTSCEVLKTDRNVVRVTLRKVKEWMAENIETASKDPALSGMLRAIVLGEKWAAEEEEVALYTDAGIGHLLAISGLHVSLAGMSVYRLLKKRMKLSYRFSALAGICFLYCYFVISGEGTSAKRACLMLAVYSIGQVFGRQYDLPVAASAAALVMLVQSPLLLLQSGFLLSFGSVLSLGLLLPELEGFLKGFDFVKKALFPGVAIQLFTLPIQAVSFYRIPVYGLFLNLLVLPLFPAAAVSGFLAGFLGWAVPPVWQLLLSPAKWIFQWYDFLSEKSLAFVGSVFLTGKPGHWQLLACGAGLAGCYVFLRKRKAVFLLLCCFLVGSLAPLPSRKLELVFLDVGQGDCCFIRMPGGTTFLVDGGSSSEKGLAEYTLEPFLDSEAAAKVDYALVSHGDGDHINGLKALMEAGRLKNLILPGGQKEKQESLRELEALAGELGVKVRSLNQGGKLSVGKAEFFCLWPENEAENGGERDANESSLVLWLSYGKFDVLFTGDLEGAGEKKTAAYIESLKEKERELQGKKLEILKVGHHGSAGGSSKGFLEAVRPLYGVVSCGKDNRYGHPAEETLNRMAEVGCHVLRTDEGGAVLVETDGKTMELRQMKVKAPVKQPLQ